MPPYVKNDRNSAAENARLHHRNAVAQISGATNPSAMTARMNAVAPWNNPMTAPRVHTDASV
jgi:hypothetical protein